MTRSLQKKDARKGTAVAVEAETPDTVAVPREDGKLAEIVRRLVDAYDPDRVYLFGSTARGDAGPDSDYDLMVVVPDDAPRERRRAGLAYEVLWEAGRAADVVVQTRQYFTSRLHLKASLPATVEREGRLLYAK